MSDFDKTNTGIISKNDRKEKDTHPDIRGDLNVEGVDYWISGWRKERKDGSGSFYSLSVKRKDDQKTPKPNAPARMEDDDDIPFANPYRGKYSYVV